MATLKELIRKALQMTTPTGTMLPFAGKSVPEGWLLCNGAAVSRTTYANLFAAIGTAWGAGDGSTTFNLPDLNERFIEGTTDASKVGTYLEAGLPNITGELGYPTCETARTDGGAFKLITSTKSGRAAGSGGGMVGWDFSATRSSAIYTDTQSVQPNSSYVLIIIKA